MKYIAREKCGKEMEINYLFARHYLKSYITEVPHESEI
jgi:hypothetical protein|uniref:Uncharacterized protein n=1 Tax=Siphoviridae sp. ctP6113 TaxID=2826318 RepID=A0A8S5MUC1_9CAUD|nr:MAG TPA: hypothetical protein [Siphoviridae sp. ctP6113]